MYTSSTHACWLFLCRPPYISERRLLNLRAYVKRPHWAACVTSGTRLHRLCRTGTEDWERLVPQHVRDQIKSLHLLGYTSQPRYKLPSGNGSKAGNGKPANGVPKEGAAAGAA